MLSPGIFFRKWQHELSISRSSLFQIRSIRRLSFTMAPRLQSFEILQRGLGECSSQRLGLLKLAKRRDIETPNLLALTSKGSVPHLTPDVLGAETAIQAIHAGFEDCKGEIHHFQLD